MVGGGGVGIVAPVVVADDGRVVAGAAGRARPARGLYAPRRLVPARRARFAAHVHYVVENFCGLGDPHRGWRPNSGVHSLCLPRLSSSAPRLAFFLLRPPSFSFASVLISPGRCDDAPRWRRRRSARDPHLDGLLLLPLLLESLDFLQKKFRFSLDLLLFERSGLSLFRARPKKRSMKNFEIFFIANGY